MKVNFYAYLLFYNSMRIILQIRTFMIPQKGSLYVTLRFDDATLDQYEIAWPLLEKYNVKATISVPTAYVGKHIIEYGRLLKCIDDWKKLKELANAGWDVLPHGRHHLSKGPYMFLDEKSLFNEIVGSKFEIRKNLGIDSRIFIPPGIIETQNPLGKREIKLINKYYDAFTLNSGFNYPILLYNKIKSTTRRLYAIPATDTDKWVKYLIFSLMKLKKDSGHSTHEPKLLIVLFFHEIYDTPSKKTVYGFSKKRLSYLVEKLLEVGITFVTLSEVLNMG